MKSLSLYINFVRFFLGMITMGSILSCQTDREKIKISGTTKGLDGYVVNLELNDSTVAGENIIDGQFNIHTTLPQEDFYVLKLNSNNDKEDDKDFLIYLTEGNYSVNIDSALIDRYPVLESHSPIQKDLIEYYRIKDKNGTDFQKEYAVIKQIYDTEYLNYDADELKKITADFLKAETKLRGNIDYSKKEFITRNPGSLVSAYFLSNFQDIEYMPAPYLEIYHKLGAEAKESKYGKSAKKLIEQYTKASPNTFLPEISGFMPNGKGIDKNSLRGKLSLVMFWMSLNKDSRDDTDQLMEMYKEFHPQGFEIVGISFDSSKERWQEYISQKELPWVQVYDTEGIKSLNIKNFGNTKIPYYFLIGPDLKIIERNPPIESIPIYHKEYLENIKKQ